MVLAPAAYSKKKKKKKNKCRVAKFHFKAKDATGKLHNLQNFKEPVVLAVYAGKNTADVNEDVHDGLKKDKDLKKGGELNSYFNAFGVANYQETWVPNAIIAYLIKRKIEKYKVTIWDDRDNCFSGSGESDDCLDKKRRKIFVDGKQNSTVFYKGRKMRNFVGDLNKQKFIDYIKTLARAAKEKKNFCEAKELANY